MSCVLDINDIVIEMATGPVTPIAGLSKEESAAIIAAVRITVDQPCDVITDKGVGCYGLQVSDLQAIGVVKKGFEITNEMLECGSSFTGKNGIFTVDEIITNNKLQQQMMNDLIIANMQNLQAQGIITGGESDQELSGLAALAAKYLPSQIKSLIDAAGSVLGAIGSALGAVGDAFGAIADGFAALDQAQAIALAALAAGGALLASLKNADILGKLKGFGETIAGLPELALDTIDSFTLDVEVDKLVGVPNLPSVSDPTKTASEAADGLLSGNIPSVPSLPDIPSLPDVTASIPVPPTEYNI